MAAMGEVEASNAGEQLARNSLSETHPDEEPGRPFRPLPVLFIRFSHRTVRSPYALKNSCGERLRRPAFKLLRRQITQRRVQTRGVVIAFDECVEVGAQILDVPVLETANFFLLQRFHEAFALRVVV